MEEEFAAIAKQPDEAVFFETLAHLEQIFSHLSSLITIALPFKEGDFSPIYLSLLDAIPSALRPLCSATLHTTAMGSVSGIFKAAQEIKGDRLRTLYGENIYFECIFAAENVSDAIPMEKATAEDWRDADLLLIQYNPVLRRENPRVGFYHPEDMEAQIRRALEGRSGKPLIVAIDCTIAFIDSLPVGKVLAAFQSEIEKGDLAIACYRSGLKFDLFGMDNFAGAPFYFIRSSDPKWKPLNSLLTDPALLADELSANWFSLAYKAAPNYLNRYRQQIMKNTRELLTRIPPRLFDKESRYRIIPVEESADPVFVDFRVFGPFHQFKAAALVSGPIYFTCMQGGHPVFYRRSIGFPHPNYGILFGEEVSIVRLTIGLDPSQIDLLVACFESIDTLNGCCKVSR